MSRLRASLAVGIWGVFAASLVGCSADRAPVAASHSSALANGASCASGASCDSGICEDAVCCAISCGPCSSCDATGTACVPSLVEGTACSEAPRFSDSVMVPGNWSGTGVVGETLSIVGNTSLRSIAIDTHGATAAATLSFRQYRQQATYGSPTYVGFDADLYDGVTNAHLGEVFFAGPSNTDWVTTTVPIGALIAGHPSVRIQFNVNVYSAGAVWYIDDVVLHSGIPELCATCDASGQCNQPRVDDPACGTIDCDALDTTCADYHDLTANRCGAAGACKVANSGQCDQMTPMALNTSCTNGTDPSDDFEAPTLDQWQVLEGGWAPSTARANQGLQSLNVFDIVGQHQVQLAEFLPIPGTYAAPSLEFESWLGGTGTNYAIVYIVDSAGIQTAATYNPHGWTKQTISLAPWIGKSIKVRFMVYFFAGTVSGDQSKGWSIDSLRINTGKLLHCAACNGAGLCNAVPSDDATCGTIDCDGLDYSCRDYQSLTHDRCGSYGFCKPPNHPTTCVESTNAIAGTDCAQAAQGVDTFDSSLAGWTGQAGSSYAGTGWIWEAGQAHFYGATGVGTYVLSKNAPVQVGPTPRAQYNFSFSTYSTDTGTVQVREAWNPTWTTIANYSGITSGTANIALPASFANQKVYFRATITTTVVRNGTFGFWYDLDNVLLASGNPTTCASCDGAGSCAGTPADDAKCGTIDCDGLDRTCRNYADLTANRCEGFGDCKDANQASDCTVFTNATPGTDCGTCAECDASGACSVMPADDAVCPTIDCNVNDNYYSGCRDYSGSIATNRCASLNACKNSSHCTDYTIAAGQKCALCAVCSSTGFCNQAAADDSACGTINCNTLDDTCRDYDPLTTNRCAGTYACKTANTTDCTSYTNAPNGTRCGTCAGCGLGVCGLITLADDDACGTIDCDRLDEPCRDFADLATNRCAYAFQCKNPNDPSTCGAGTVKPAGTVCEPLLASEGFEDDAFYTNNPWAKTSLVAHSGSRSLTDSPSGNYINNRNTTIYWYPDPNTGDLLLPNTPNPVLRFWHRYDLEPVNDYVTVYVNWSAADYSTSGSVLLATIGSDSPQLEWKQLTLSLAPYAGRYVSIRFGLRSNASITADGWYVDDLEILASDASCQGCDVAGQCNTVAVDDPKCGTIDCDALDTTCRDYSDLTTARCQAVGQCKPANDAGSCTAFADQPSGFDCGVCAACDGSGACTDDLAQDADCGACQKCTAKDSCALQTAAEDQQDECPSGACTTGLCDGAGGCGRLPTDTDCDGDVCTVGDQCAQGGCVAGSTALPCDDADPCTADGCDSSSGCTHVPLSVGDCTDGSLCTTGDTCSEGACFGASINCDDGDPCTADSCEGQVGCVYTATNEGGSCATATRCGGTCVAGTCTGGSTVACDDANPCTIDSCNAQSGGCVHAPIANDTSCDDGEPCNGAETCQGGVCKPGPILACGGDLLAVDLLEPDLLVVDLFEPDLRVVDLATGATADLATATIPDLAVPTTDDLALATADDLATTTTDDLLLAELDATQPIDDLESPRDLLAALDLVTSPPVDGAGTSTAPDLAGPGGTPKDGCGCRTSRDGGADAGLSLLVLLLLWRRGRRAVHGQRLL